VKRFLIFLLVFTFVFTPAIAKAEALSFGEILLITAISPYCMMLVGCLGLSIWGFFKKAVQDKDVQKNKSEDKKQENAKEEDEFFEDFGSKEELV